MYEIAIIGAGVVGGMIARTLAKYRLKICILEKENDVAMGATKANSAIVHAGFDAKPGSLKAKLNVRGNQMMPTVCRELGVKYRQNGSLVLGFQEEDRQTLQELLERGKKNGVAGLQILEKEELLQKEPQLSHKVLCALYAPTGGIVCPYELTVAAIGNAMDNGAELRCNFRVTGIAKTETGYRVSSREEAVDARYVINCAGLFSDEVAKLAGDTSFTVHPRRGEYILLDKTCGSLARHTLFRTPSKMGKGILVTPTVDGNLLLGPTSFDISDKENNETTQEGFRQIIQNAREDIPAIPMGAAITSFCGLRAVGSTGDFIITSPREQFLNVAGIESPGLTASPAIAEYVAQLLAEQGLELIEKTHFDPKRAAMHAFREMSPEEKNAIIRQDPAYGKILCRCESITEGEILAAIRTNPKARDLDGVKRRTRAQMGRCQGGFCGPAIMELLARELGIPFEEVTKCGGGSFLNIGKTKGGAAQ